MHILSVRQRLVLTIHHSWNNLAAITLVDLSNQKKKKKMLQLGMEFEAFNKVENYKVIFSK